MDGEDTTKVAEAATEVAVDKVEVQADTMMEAEVTTMVATRA